MFATALVLLACTFFVLYFYIKYLYSYWHRRGVTQLEPTFPFGNFGKSFRNILSASESLDELYRSTNEPFVGIYSLFRPTLMPRDPELIRNILIIDFQHFADRGVDLEKNDPLSAHLFSLKGDEWKNLRAKFTLTFTSGKMRGIFTTILECRGSLMKHLAKFENQTVEVRNISVLFTTNVIASVAFGIDVDCFADPDNPFRRFGRKMTEPSWKNKFRLMCFFFRPTLLKWSGLHFLDRDVEEFLYDIVRQTLELRESGKVVRKDFFQLLVQLRNTGAVQLDDEWNSVLTNEENKKLSIDQMTAQSFLFYVAGFETTASTMSFLLFEVARSPEIQQKLHDEIDAMLDESADGEFTYDTIQELKYLECCFDETLRKYSVVQVHNRICTKDYRISGTDVVIEKGTDVVIAPFSLQRDEKYYPNPEKFDPSRFSSENKSGKTFVDMPYMPFGDGPRVCIGIRMAKLTVKVAVASILRKYDIELDEQHIGRELKICPTSELLTAISGINLKFKSRQM